MFIWEQQWLYKDRLYCITETSNLFVVVVTFFERTVATVGIREKICMNYYFIT